MVWNCTRENWYQWLQYLVYGYHNSSLHHKNKLIQVNDDEFNVINSRGDAIWSVHYCINIYTEVGIATENVTQCLGTVNKRTNLKTQCVTTVKTHSHETSTTPTTSRLLYAKHGNQWSHIHKVSVYDNDIGYHALRQKFWHCFSRWRSVYDRASTNAVQLMLSQCLLFHVNYP